MGQLLEYRFDYIFFIGSFCVGKIVMIVVVKYLIFVILELGGKNFCYVDDNCDFQIVVNCVVWFCYFNVGQICVVFDYVLCSFEMQERLLFVLQSIIICFYGDDFQSFLNLGCIINQKQFQWLWVLLGCGCVVIGGQSDESDCYIVFMVLVDVQEMEFVMQEEIFGFILFIVNVQSLDEVIEFINWWEKFLVLYVFFNSSQVVKWVLIQISSGGFCGNDGFMYMILVSLFFGGVGVSGMGWYYGKFFFDIFFYYCVCFLCSLGMEKFNVFCYLL